MDPLSLIGGIGSAIGSFGQGILSPVLGWFSNDDNNENLWRMALLQNYINQRNVDKTNALNEQLQREQWQRDDTAYQRQVKDMTAAGLNPLSQFNSPVSSPLSAGFQAAQFNIPKTSAFDFSNLGKGFSDLGNAMLQQRQLNIADKKVNLDAITHGVNPNSLSVISDNDELVNFFKKIFEANLKDLEKNANSPYVKGEGILSRTAKDVKESVNTISDIMKNYTGSSPKDVVDSVRNIKPVNSSDTKEGQNRRYEYYYNSAHKNKNSKFRALKNFLGAKLGW